MIRHTLRAADDLRAGEPARRQCQEQRPEPNRASRGGMNRHMWFAAVLLVFTLGGCAKVPAGQGQAPGSPQPNDRGTDIRDM